MKVTARLKDEIARYTLALNAVNRGDFNSGAEALQMLGLTNDQIKYGLVERLSYAVRSAKSGHRRIAKATLDAAEQAIATAQAPPKKHILLAVNVTITDDAAGNQVIADVLLPRLAQFAAALGTEFPSLKPQVVSVTAIN